MGRGRGREWQGTWGARGPLQHRGPFECGGGGSGKEARRARPYFFPLTLARTVFGKTVGRAPDFVELCQVIFLSDFRRPAVLLVGLALGPNWGGGSGVKGPPSPGVALGRGLCPVDAAVRGLQPWNMQHNHLAAAAIKRPIERALLHTPQGPDDGWRSRARLGWRVSCYWLQEGVSHNGQWGRIRLATSVRQLRHDQMEQGPTEPRTGRGMFLLSFGGAGGEYY